MEMDLNKFDPTVAELAAVAEASRAITITDFDDRTQVEAVHSHRMILKNARISIEKRGKELREDAVKFSKAVIAKEKELIAMIEPEEIRLDQLEDAAKQNIIEKERLRKWPERQERLKEIEWIMGSAADSTVMMMPDVDFEAFLNQAKAKIEAERLAVQRTLQEARELELKRKEDEIKAKEDAIHAKEREEEAARIRVEELERARLDGERKAREEQAREDMEEEQRKLREAAEAKAAATRLEKTKKYREFLAANGWTEETRGDFKIEETTTGYVLYKRLGEFVK